MTIRIDFRQAVLAAAAASMSVCPLPGDPIGFRQAAFAQAAPSKTFYLCQFQKGSETRWSGGETRLSLDEINRQWAQAAANVGGSGGRCELSTAYKDTEEVWAAGRRLPGAVSVAFSTQEPAAAPEPSGKQVFMCTYTDASDRVHVYAAVESSLSERELLTQFIESANGNIQKLRMSYCTPYRTGKQPWASTQEVDSFAQAENARYDYMNYQKREWTPTEGAAVSSKLRRETVFFGDPKPSLGQKGYSNNTFDVEYQFIACMGELHLAYSVVDNSVRSKDTTYLLDGVYYRVSPAASTVSSIPLFGEVWIEPHHTHIIGKYADDHASKALGFGCFSGQTKKIANLADLKNDLGKPATKDELPAIFERLRVNFVTKELLTSSAAEEEIRSGLAKKAADERERSGEAGLDAARADRARRNAEAEAREAQRAAKEAEFQAKMKAYEEGVAARNAAIEQYNTATKEMEAQKIAAAERARAVQEEYARQQAAHQAELDRHAKARAEYEAQIAGQASVTIPKP